MYSKRASLELSIRMIVIVILAMTLLGLGLGFIRNTFGDIRELSGDVTEQIKQQIMDDLITNDKKISFTKTEVNINKGGSEILTVGIRNKEDETLNFKMILTAQSGPDDANLNDIENWFQYRKDMQKLSSSEADVRSMRISVPKDAKTGSYFLTFDIVDVKDTPNNDNDDEVYATKDLFIVVKT